MIPEGSTLLLELSIPQEARRPPHFLDSPTEAAVVQSLYGRQFTVVLLLEINGIPERYTFTFEFSSPDM